MTKASLLRLIAITTLLSGACSISDQKAPDLTGPSELGLSLAITATPDLIAANGVQESRIDIVARDPSGQPLRDVQLRIDVVQGDTIVQTGTLSDRYKTTDSSGRASVTFTAPMESDFGLDTNGTVRVRVLPVSTNFGSQWERFVTIRLVPPTTTVPAPGAPTPDFFFNPPQPRPVLDDITFDASRSFDADGFIVSYKWTWGDGQSETTSRVTATHDYASAGTYNVTLTVTDNGDLQQSVTKQIRVQ
jgi:PKD repeat protein